MYVKYGSLAFEPWEASLTNVLIQTRYSPRQFKESQIVQMFVDGDVVATDQYAVTDRLEQIRAALSVDGQDFGLYHDDDTPTVHYLESANALNLTGNQVFQKRFPAEHGAEYVNGREFHFGVKAEIADYETSLIEYRDSVRQIGDGSPIFQWFNTERGIKVDKVTPNSYQRIVHSGYAKTTVPWFTPPSPYYARPFYLGHLTDIEYIGPDRYPQAAVNYTTTWKYYYVIPFPTTNTPTIR